ncbi:hypothetical protein [Niabella hibiscisoli]|uniref:hypothetical protein n=1 Tax=Niabella hibiscisoli TaxID=1825928 RepID=UPI001F10EFD7|nr:hypothetical protein [Niabella hibiscisoli]MCH5717483.1 hypothetical protein [Niabella hibiscisoli]
MKFLSIACIAATMALISCKDGGKEVASAPFCSDTTCLTEPMKFESEAPGKPFVRISYKDCQIDSIHWEKGGMGVIKDIIFSEFIPNVVKPSKQFLTCSIIDGKYAWVKFNDCATGRGYLLKLPFEKTGTTAKFTSAINNFDPKFKVEEGLVAYYDNTFIYVEDMTTGQIAKQLLTDQGVTDMDYDNVHRLIDSVNITKANIYAKLNVDKKK